MYYSVYTMTDLHFFLCSLLHSSDVCTDGAFHASCIELCGCMFVTSAVFSQNARPPFLLLRQTINSIVECVEGGGGSGECVVGGGGSGEYVVGGGGSGECVEGGGGSGECVEGGGGSGECVVGARLAFCDLYNLFNSMQSK